MNKSIKRQSQIVVAALLAAQTCAMLPLASYAGPVRLAGSQVFNVSTGGGGLTVDARTTTIQRNLDNALVATPNPSPSSVSIVYVKGQPIITVGGFYVTTVDGASAKLAKTTPALLAQKWADGIKAGLKDPASVSNYVAQLNGSSTSAHAGTTSTETGSYPYYQQGRIVHIPAGLTIPVQLSTAISSDAAKAGDRIEARVAQDVQLGDTSIPAGTVAVGTVTESASGGRLGKSGMLGLKFNSLRTPNGQEIPITAHIVGGIGKYQEIGQSDIVKGESTATKAKQAAIRGAIGAGGGALVGTAIGAIAGGGRGAGRGAIFGTAIGAGVGVAQSLLLRKGSEVKVASGETLQLQLDAPASLAVSGNAL
jgi:hypothetical protein